MTYIFIWLFSSALAFAALRHLALRDFGSVTVGNAILLTLFSLLTPCALITALILWLMDCRSPSIFGKVIWTRR